MTDKTKFYTSLKKYAFAQGADLFGVADIREIKKDFQISPELLKSCNVAVSLGVGLSRGVLQEINGAPTKLYFHHYRTANAFLDQLAFKVAHYIQKKGFTAIPIPASQIVDWEKQSGHLSHRTVAAAAGVGWIGRNNLLVTKPLGSQLRLATILTDMPLKADAPLTFSCGTCRACVAVCPAGALGEKPADYDYHKCFSKLKDFQKQRLVDQYICGVCVNACVGGKK